MHDDEVDTNISLVGRLLTAQFPQWADLPIEPVRSAGTVNAIYRLGDDMAVRLPRTHWATGDLDKEHRWLPRLAPFLPLAIPVPLAKGKPGEGYPWHWSVYRWIEGENATVERIADPHQAATDLAQFVAALQQVNFADEPPLGRGMQLAMRDAHTLRHSFGKNLIDTGTPQDQVATLLGHESLDTTRIYTQPSERDLERAVRRASGEFVDSM
jgi:aminoglycoside phosphotransferase (APT) family kinase protein